MRSRLPSWMRQRRHVAREYSSGFGGHCQPTHRGIPSSRSDLGHLQDRVPYLFGEHELRVRRDSHEHLVELEIAAFPRFDDGALAQQVDEVLEQRAVEELGRIEA